MSPPSFTAPPFAELAESASTVSPPPSRLPGLPIRLAWRGLWFGCDLGLVPYNEMRRLLGLKRALIWCLSPPVSFACVMHSLACPSVFVAASYSHTRCVFRMLLALLLR